MYMSILANGTNFRRQRYGDFHIPTIPFLCHSIYHKYGISQKNVQQSAIGNILYHQSGQHKTEDGSDVGNSAIAFVVGVDRLLVL